MTTRMRRETKMVRSIGSKEAKERDVGALLGSRKRVAETSRETKKVVRWFGSKKADEIYVREVLESRRRVEKSGIFDIKCSESGLSREVCRVWRPCPVLVSAYAKLGLHRYNMFKETNFEFIRVSKYVYSTGAAAARYYITFHAKDPAAGVRSQTFQTQVKEFQYGTFSLACYIARLRVETNIGSDDDYTGPGSKFYNGLDRSLPEWPPHNPFQNRKRFSVVKESDNGWIRLYLELAVATTYRDFTSRPSDYDPSKLQILKVAMETVEVENEGPDADNVTLFYIKFKDLFEDRVGKDVDRVAIIRRSFNQVTGWFSLEGQTQSCSEIVIPPKKIKKNQRRLFRQRFGIHKPWLLSFPRVCKSYKNHDGLDLRHLHKTGFI